MIPDIKLFEIVKSCVKALREEHALNGGTPSNTILWHLLNPTKQADTSKYKWYEQAVEIFITRDKNHDKYLDTRLFFDRERASIPTLHIMMSGEDKGKDGIGGDLGYNDAQVIGTSQRPVLNKQFAMNANIIVTTDNPFETVIIYSVIKAMLISLNTHIQLFGFINPIISGRDIQLSQEVAPAGIYSRAINFHASYELSVPEVALSKIGQFVFIQMQNIDGQTVTPVIGPGPISGDTVIDTEASPIGGE